MGSSHLDRINNPDDLKAMDPLELMALSEEIREFIIEATRKNGGHLASNLGTVELTLALHRVFTSPRDKIVWDVGHQAYTHKILTGRKEGFSRLRRLNGLSGFPRREESPHDITDPGHASTSISTGIGVRKGLDLSGVEGDVIAVIGDGSLTGGLALEALNFTGHIPNNLIIIVNDNSMSIDKNVGAISSSLSRMAASSGYVHFSQTFDRMVRSIPILGKPFYQFYTRLKKSYKSLFYRDGLFTELGFKYIGPIDGHNIALMEKVFLRTRVMKRPVVIHIKTIKGKGMDMAEGDPAGYHGVSPLDLDSEPVNSGMTLTKAFSEALMTGAGRDKRITAITAAMKEGTGLAPFAKAYGDRFFDVGIAESHGVTFAAGLAIAGMKPVVAIYSTFMQRVVDQLIHDVAIPSLPVVFVLDRAGLIPGDGETHQGIFDLALFRSVPNLDILCPVTSDELKLCFFWALEQSNPVLIRYSKMISPPGLPECGDPIVRGQGVFLRKNEKPCTILFLTLGGLADRVLDGADLLGKEFLPADVYNLRFGNNLDSRALIRLVEPYELVVMVEEGVKSGGVGESVASLFLEEDLPVNFLSLAVPNRFPPAATRDELIGLYELDGAGIYKRVLNKWQSNRFKKVVDQVKNDTWEGKKL